MSSATVETNDDDACSFFPPPLSRRVHPHSPRHARRGGAGCRPRGAAPGGKRAHQGAVGAARSRQSRLFVGHRLFLFFSLLSIPPSLFRCSSLALFRTLQHELKGRVETCVDLIRRER